MTSARRDYFQIPYDPFPYDIENGLVNGNLTGSTRAVDLRDGQHETDAGVLFSWVHTFNSHLLTTVSPFYHYNSGDYASNPNDNPVASTENRKLHLRRRSGHDCRQLQEKRSAGRIPQLLPKR